MYWYFSRMFSPSIHEIESLCYRKYIRVYKRERKLIDSFYDAQKENYKPINLMIIDLYNLSKEYL